MIRGKAMHTVDMRPASGTGWFDEYNSVITDDEFQQFSQLIYATAGIKLTPIKKTMLAARLRKRLRATNRTSFSAYLDHLLSPEGRRAELVPMLDAVSTNKTNFFREPGHYDQLVNQVLPELLRRRGGDCSAPLRIWSAGCATGEEPYTLAMVMADFCATRPGLDFSILATDLSTGALATARLATYEDFKVDEIPVSFRHKYMMRGIGEKRGWHRVVPRLRSKVTFRRLNFMDEEFGLDRSVDILFCRNVIIYFDRDTQVGLFRKFYRQLAPGGYLFIGHSETLQGIVGQMRRVGTALYQKKV